MGAITVILTTTTITIDMAIDITHLSAAITTISSMHVGQYVADYGPGWFSLTLSVESKSSIDRVISIHIMSSQPNRANVGAERRQNTCDGR